MLAHGEKKKFWVKFSYIGMIGNRAIKFIITFGEKHWNL
jgi:hypothetical protein